MQVPATIPEPDTSPRVFETDDTHWWDASQIYGDSKGFNETARTGSRGKLRLGDDGLLPDDLVPLLDPVGPKGNLWVGLVLMHVLFIKEHNAICDALLADEGRHWSDDELHDKARLINAALIAKIHSVEWTPAMVAHPTTAWASKVNWYGLLGKPFREHVGRSFGGGDILSGIRGSPTSHHGVPYSLTEEFVSIYRMHPLIRDEYDFASLAGGPVERATFTEIGPLDRWQTFLRTRQQGDVLYSFGIANPGAIVLHNYPDSLRDFVPDKDRPRVDLASIDILRDRERGLPRYNEFRTLLMHRPPLRSFLELTGGDETLAFELEEMYGELENVDLMVGLYAEPRPRGFAFSDTAFRVFLLMASRRLKSDRFFTVDYTQATYTQTGLEWIDENTMTTVLLRHYPELAPVIRQDNAFKPWGAPAR